MDAPGPAAQKAAGKKKFPCPKQGCDKVFVEKKYVDRHVRDIHTVKSHICQDATCKLPFASEKALKSHYGKKHKEKKFKCDFPGCDKSYAEQTILNRHKKKHTAKQFHCDICSKLFATQSELDDHKKSHPTGQQKAAQLSFKPDPNPPDKSKPWKCDKCGKYYSRESTLRTHFKDSHIEDKIQCVVCKEEFSTEKDLKVHVRQHHQANVIRCSDCGQDFATSTDLHTHKRGTKCPAMIKAKSAVQKQVATPTRTSQVVESDVGGSTYSNFVRHALGDDVHQKVLAKIGKIQDTLKLKFDQSEPASPTHGQVYLMGSNLKNFQDMLYTDPLWSNNRPGKDASANLQRYLSRAPFRTIYAFYRLDDKTQYAHTFSMSDQPSVDERGAVNDECDFNVSADWLDEADAKLLAGYLVQVLERMPVLLRDLSYALRLWAFSAAKRLCTQNNDDFKLALRAPIYKDRWDNASLGTLAVHGQHAYTVEINGYDPEKRYAWSSEFYVRVGVIDPDAQIPVAGKQCRWIGEYYEPPDEDSRNMESTDFRLAYKAAQHLSVEFFEALGSKDNVIRRVREERNRLWLTGKKQTLSHLPAHQFDISLNEDHSKPWAGEQIYSVTTTTNHYCTIWPSKWMQDAMSISRRDIVLQSTDNEKQYMVFTSILEALQAGKDATTAWGIGCYNADLQNQLLMQDSVVIRACDIQAPGHEDTLHVCPECLKLVPHRDFTALKAEARPYHVCSACAARIDGDLKAFGGWGDLLGYRLYQHLKKEDKISGKARSEAEFNTLFEEAYASIDHHSNQRQKGKNLGRSYYNPECASVEALDPFAAGPDSLSGYHTIGNIAVTTDALNRAKKHYPPVIFHGILLFVEAASQHRKDLYESAIGVFRICLMNYHECGTLTYPTQTARVGKSLPKNVEAIKQSFRHPILLPRTTSDEKVWRIWYSRQLDSSGQRATWKHKDHKWIMFQIDCAADEVFGRDVARFKHTFMRKNSAGLWVFFPFSQYSIAADFSWPDLFELMLEKAVRNVTMCQMPYSRRTPVRQYSCEELLLVVAYVWMYMVKSDIDNAALPCDYGRDQAGLVPQPNISSLLCASLGHRLHGFEQDLGLDGFELGKMEKVTFDRESCGFLWETQLCNFMKFKYAPKTIDDRVLSQLQNIRLETYAGSEPVLPQQLAQLKLEGSLADPFPPGETLRPSRQPGLRRLRSQRMHIPTHQINQLTDVEDDGEADGEKTENLAEAGDPKTLVITQPDDSDDDDFDEHSFLARRIRACRTS